MSPTVGPGLDVVRKALDEHEGSDLLGGGGEVALLVDQPVERRQRTCAPAFDLGTQRVAMQWSVRINEAYQRLKDPVRRASYLCELNGAPIEAENNTAMPGEFLMQQMEWRESLDDATAIAAVDALQAEVDAARARALSSLDWLIDEKGDFPAASQQVRALMFIERFAQDVEAKADQLGQ